MAKKAQKKRPAGFGFYRDSGFEKALLIHISAKTHANLARLADKTGKSLQTTVREILENRIAH
jgi:predicted DNA-binding protein